MTHLDAERLADHALGGVVSEEEQAHLAGCPQCDAHLADLRHFAELVAGTPVDPVWELPSPRVWDTVLTAIPELTADHGSVPPTSAPEAERAPGRVRWRRTAAVVAAAACLVVGAFVGRALWPESGGESDQPSVQLAQAPLDTLTSPPRELGEASVVETGGDTQLRLRIDPTDAGPGYLEVWLINTDLKRMVSIGVLGDSDEPTFSIPRKLLDEGYVIVDVSREGLDENPAHSGDSVMRGTLDI